MLPQVAVNTTLSPAAAGLVVALIRRFQTGRWNVVEMSAAGSDLQKKRRLPEKLMKSPLAERITYTPLLQSNVIPTFAIACACSREISGKRSFQQVLLAAGL